MPSFKVAVLTSIWGLAVAAIGSGYGGTQSETPFFCNLKALTPAERAEHQTLGARLLASIRGTDELANGYVFSLDGSQLSIRDIATWVDFERRCCPFFDFAVEWRRENGPVTLRLSGREGVKEFIRVEFPRVFRSSGAKE